MSYIKVFSFLLGAIILVTGTKAAPPKVVVSMAPIHSLVSEVMDGIAQPQLIFEGAQSPHTFTLRPSHIRTLKQANIIIWIGPVLERVLAQPLSLHASQAQQLRIIDIQNLTLYPKRTDDNWHVPCPHTHHNNKCPIDPHVWLSPDNAKVIVNAVTEVLKQNDPTNASAYLKNRNRMLKKLNRLDTELKRLVQPIQGVPYLVFHDGYQYFERHFNLNAIGAVAVNPEMPVNLKHLQNLTQIIAEKQVRCLFREPQHSAAILKRLAAQTNTHIGILDPIGSYSPETGKGYFDMMRNLVHNLVKCLKQGKPND